MERHVAHKQAPALLQICTGAAEGRAATDAWPGVAATTPPLLLPSVRGVQDRQRQQHSVGAQLWRKKTLKVGEWCAPIERSMRAESLRSHACGAAFEGV
eukprot:scaffold202302_cov30-Tisochrysis_lutea.AAC.1